MAAEKAAGYGTGAGGDDQLGLGDGVVRGVIDSLMKVMAALETAGIEFINEGATSTGGGRGVRLRQRPQRPQ